MKPTATVEQRLAVRGDAAEFSDGEVERCDEPVRRYLCAAIAPGTPLARAARLRMRGSIKVANRWVPFRADELLTLDCLDCPPWAQGLMDPELGFVLIGASDDERLRLLKGYPSQPGYPARLLDNGVLHERDGVFYGHGGAGQFIFSFVMARKLTPRVRPQP